MRYQPDWIEFRIAVNPTAERFGQPDIGKVAEDLFRPCRNKHVKGRFSEMPDGKTILTALWDHRRPDGASIRTLDVFVDRRDLAKWWRKVEAPPIRTPAARPTDKRLGEWMAENFRRGTR